MANLPSVRPRLVIGTQTPHGIVMTGEFARWLDLIRIRSDVTAEVGDDVVAALTSHITDVANPHDTSYLTLDDREPQDGNIYGRKNNAWGQAAPVVHAHTDLDTRITDLETAPSREYASFYLSTGGITGQGSTANTVVINQTSVNSNAAIFILAANEVTINKAMDIEVDFGCYFNNSSTSRTEYTFWLEINTIEVPGSRSGNYQRGYDSGQSSDIHMIIPVVSGDVLRVRVVRTDGGSTAGYQDDNGTRLTITEASAP